VVRVEPVVEDIALGEDTAKESQRQSALATASTADCADTSEHGQRCDEVHVPTPTRSPDRMWKDNPLSTIGPSCAIVSTRNTARNDWRTGEYRALRFSTRMSPLAGQYAGGWPPSLGSGSYNWR
jgi:hypothetical protein